MRRWMVALGLVVMAVPAMAEEAALREFRFNSIDGGEIGFADWSGQPVLVANTASLCGYTPQYAELQDLYDAYRDRGLVVLAVPSDDFSQELDTNRQVQEFCELNYDLDLPMAGITPVKGSGAHPFFAWLRESAGFEPKWNFNKVLVGADGRVVGTWGSGESPTGPAIRGAVEAALGS